MTVEQAGAYWESNAATWTSLARAGYDVYRDELNTPAFFDSLPQVHGMAGLDIGCGEGHNTRLLAQRKAIMSGLDISPTFIEAAIAMEKMEPFHIDYRLGSATALPYAPLHFDFATSFMCLMDLPDPVPALREVHRVLKPGGFFQFSITHPCFNTSQRRNIKGPDGLTTAVEISDYFKPAQGRVDEWIFNHAPPALTAKAGLFKTPFFHYPLSYWITNVIAAGFVLEFLAEPCPGEDVIIRHPRLAQCRLTAFFLHIRCRKTG